MPSDKTCPYIANNLRHNATKENNTTTVLHENSFPIRYKSIKRPMPTLRGNEPKKILKSELYPIKEPHLPLLCLKHSFCSSPTKFPKKLPTVFTSLSPIAFSSVQKTLIIGIEQHHERLESPTKPVFNQPGWNHH